MPTNQYTSTEVESILEVYRRLVTNVDNELKRYWDRAHEVKSQDVV